jgi:hypothetical protein
MRIRFLKLALLLALLIIPFVASGQGQQVECGTDLAVTADDDIVNFNGITSTDQDQIAEVSFPGTNSVIVDDTRCDDSGFTVSVNADDYVAGGNSIPYSNLQFKTTSFETLYGDSTGISAPRAGSYAPFSGTGQTSNEMDILLGDTTVRDPSQWGLNPTLKLTVPAYSSNGTFENTLTFSIL